VDAGPVWTAVGSAAGVVGVGATVAVAVFQTRSSRRFKSKVSAELALGYLSPDGVLNVEFISGERDVIGLAKNEEASAGRKKSGKKPRDTEKKIRENLKLTPVNVIFIRNQGGTPVTVTRCHYLGELGDTSFRFEPQPASSPRGDRLPKRLEPGEEAILVHELVMMRVFLNQVLRDHGVTITLFLAVLSLGHGVEIAAPPAMEIRADMTKEDIEASGAWLTRQQLATPPVYRNNRVGRRWWRRKNR
jgi:hypothetical protein